jgi:hypothetical protein
MSITVVYDKAMDDAAVAALHSVVTNHPSTTIADLRELLAGHPRLGDVTLTEMFGAAPVRAKAGRPKGSKSAAKPAAAARPAAQAAAPAEAKKPAGKRAKREGGETRTAEGRAALDQAVLEGLTALGGSNVSAEALRKRIGTTPAQLRASLNRHIQAGDVSFTGKARGTRYTLE